MTVYEKRGKLVLSPGIEYPELLLYEFAKDYGVNVDVDKLRKQGVGVDDVRRALGFVTEADFLVYESYGFIYVFEIGY
jgi:hypothetical protein